MTEVLPMVWVDSGPELQELVKKVTGVENL